MSDDQIMRVNVEKLQNQVRRECLAEEKYWRENDAKLRAIEQRVPTYDDFRQMVLASHLKPLDKGETLAQNFKNKSAWNPAHSNAATTTSEQPIAPPQMSTVERLLSAKPNSCLEFRKVWTQFEALTGDEDILALKWQFLVNLGDEKLKLIFKSEINGDLLGQFFKLFEFKSNQFNTNDDDSEMTNACVDCNYILKLLDLFSLCNRFKLNLMFLQTTEINSLNVTLNNLTRISEQLKLNLDDILKLEKAYSTK